MPKYIEVQEHDDQHLQVLHRYLARSKCELEGEEVFFTAAMFKWAEGLETRMASAIDGAEVSRRHARSKTAPQGGKKPPQAPKTVKRAKTTRQMKKALKKAHKR